jgi:two-component sensor histidine kinase
MALVHEKLYRSHSLAHVDFGEYVNSLAAQLFQSYSEKNIKWHCDIENVYFDIETAIPCGLIVNELISNAVQHAFPKGREGTVMVSIRSLTQYQFVLTVGDDGIGLPTDFDITDASSLGMHIILSLIEQLDGTLEIKKDKGTMFMITFFVPTK